MRQDGKTGYFLRSPFAYNSQEGSEGDVAEIDVHIFLAKLAPSLQGAKSDAAISFCEISRRKRKQQKKGCAWYRTFCSLMRSSISFSREDLRRDRCSLCYSYIASLEKGSSRCSFLARFVFKTSNYIVYFVSFCLFFYRFFLRGRFQFLVVAGWGLRHGAVLVRVV